ncbi:hypothetical protein AcW2_010382 [Taiwanofungus camphoratus]|nr:hypothetical protein AcW2_010382 [Antrodia cinnamomea]
MASIDLGGSRTKTRARLVTHTIGRVAAWQRFHKDRHLKPEMTTADSRKFRDFQDWYDADLKASELFQTWVDEGIANDRCRF